MPKYTYSLTNGKTLTLEGDTQPADADVEAAAKTAGVSLVPVDTSVPKTPGVVSAPTSIMQSVLNTGKDLAVGAVKGVGSTVKGIDELLGRLIPINDPRFDSTMQTATQQTTPSNTAQSVGKGVEQVAEFLAPIGAGEKVASAVGAGPKVARIIAGAVNPGIVAAAQSGGDPSTIGGTAALGGALSALAPLAAPASQKIYERALKPATTAQNISRIPRMATMLRQGTNEAPTILNPGGLNALEGQSRVVQHTADSLAQQATRDASGRFIAPDPGTTMASLHAQNAATNLVTAAETAKAATTASTSSQLYPTLIRALLGGALGGALGTGTGGGMYGALTDAVIGAGAGALGTPANLSRAGAVLQNTATGQSTTADIIRALLLKELGSRGDTTPSLPSK